MHGKPPVVRVSQRCKLRRTPGQSKPSAPAGVSGFNIDNAVRVYGAWSAVELLVWASFWASCEPGSGSGAKSPRLAQSSAQSTQ